MSTFNTVWPVATFILGGASAYLRDYISERRQIARTVKALDAERAKGITDRRESFELENLTKLADALQRLSRVSTQAHLADMPDRESPQVYGSSPLPPEIDEGARVAHAEVSLLTAMVLKASLREQITEARQAIAQTAMMFGGPARDAQQAHMNALDLMDSAMQALAARVREIYVTAEPPEGTEPGGRRQSPRQS
ncbi:hypothetical protein ABTX35_28630 [Streptomyces sp. NPDC096080]|uniref:hypothetical protein n=1 Tax=Streptomyces sp. NPDC096080 TaxID=3156693 RepID=UPI00331B129B